MSLLIALKNRLTLISQQHGRRLTLVAILLFLTFDFIALSLNVWLSYRIESSAININLAGRQRMLSQRLVKGLLMMEQSRLNEQMYLSSLSEVNDAFVRFDQTLDSFYRGGTTLSAARDTIQIEPLKSDATVKLVHEAMREWTPLRQKVRQLIGREFDDLLLRQAIEVAQQKNNILLKIMNQLTIELERETKQEAMAIRFYQGLAFFLAIINVCVAIVMYRLRVQEADHSVDLVHNIMNRIASGIIVVDQNQTIIRANTVIADMCGYDLNELSGYKLIRLLQEHDGEMYGVKKQGEKFHCQVESSDVFIGNNPVIVYTIIDDSQQLAQQQALTKLAYHDQLTGLPNRYLFHDRLSVEIKHARRRVENMALVFIDLNGFKVVNDRYGHKFGDLLLAKVARRMKKTVRKSDTVARLGGDEFTLLMTDVNSPTQCKQMIEKLLAAVCKPYLINDALVDVGASVGVACFPADADNEQDLLSLADKAMYVSKATGESRITFANESLLQ
ncbi:diguanylate cyclase domain-containing protein [Alteromonas gilva]|uniref:Diguanylate cyclase n=1 Tax=Alteromonas gilva TaxID=2987522 RepID=A0ABT5L5S1_9ALTE|nr:diguanylate cyclase [Alteromonas gilva]MDC8832399.1 diguanylate cyclase [Alteromonas gilva]